MCVRSEEHQDSALDALRQTREQVAEHSEAPLHVLTLEIEFELITEKVADYCGENLRVRNEMLADMFDAKVCPQFLVKNFHRLESTACKDDAQRFFFWITHDLAEGKAWSQALDAPLSDVVLGLPFRAFIRSNEEF